MSRLFPFLALSLLPATLAGQRMASRFPPKEPPKTTSGAITSADLRARLGIFADDSMAGRDALADGNLRATEYIARELRALGFQPAGENGTYFQTAVTRWLLADDARLVIDGQTFLPWRDFIPRNQHELAPVVRSLDGARAVYGGVFGLTGRTIAAEATAGKVVLFVLPPDSTSAPRWSANRLQFSQLYPAAAAIVVASMDAIPESARPELQHPLAVERGSESMPVGVRTLPAFMYASSALARVLLGAVPEHLSPGDSGAIVRGSIAFVSHAGPGRNVVAVLPGADPALRGEYVAIGAHSDHVGVADVAVDADSLRAFNSVVRPQGADNQERVPTAAESARIRAIADRLHALRGGVLLDSIYNGADDDGSGSVAMLEIAEAFATSPVKPRRSLLFVWHTAEELGLLGSRYFTDHPTVPRDSIVAQLNMDMIGRGTAEDVPGLGGPRYLALVGSRRLSSELGDVVEAVNRSLPAPFQFDYQYDAKGHPAQYYCRSDHFEYARFGIPIVFFTTGEHRDYHELTDEPRYIDYDKLARVTQLVHDLAARVADLNRRPRVDQPKPDPSGDCLQ